MWCLKSVKIKILLIFNLIQLSEIHGVGGVKFLILSKFYFILPILILPKVFWPKAAPERSPRRVLQKSRAEKFRKSSQEGTCGVVFLNKTAGYRPDFSLNRDSDTGIFARILQKYQGLIFYLTHSLLIPWKQIPQLNVTTKRYYK